MREGRRPTISASTALAAAWLVAVAAIAVAQALHFGPRDSDLASSPAGVAAGRLWPLLTSALVVAGSPLAQLLATAVLLSAVVRLYGAGTFWLAAAAGHVGATLLTYAGVGIVWLISRADVDAVVDAPDYGISAVWAAALGALAAGPAAGLKRRPAAVASVAGGLVVLAALTTVAADLAGIEHLLAFVLGYAVTRWRLGRRALEPETA